MTGEAETRLMIREQAFEDFSERAQRGESVTIHYKDEDQESCSAAALLAGLRATGRLFGYFIQDDRVHVITGQATKMDIEAKFAELQVERNGRT